MRYEKKNADWTAGFTVPGDHGFTTGNEEDPSMKMYRVVGLLVAVVVAVLLIWAVGHERVGAQEAQSILSDRDRR